jgi:hypothetical protein
MPKEHKKRGRRDDQKKRKRDHDDDDAASKRKRNRQDDAPAEPESVPFQDEAIDDVTRPGAMPFYGMLDDDEQEYFKRADEMLELNQFDGPEERTLFLESVYKEADGKELKLANSQSCSRLLERLILLSTPQQLKNLFKKFNDEYVLRRLVPSSLTAAASCISSSTALPRTAVKLCSYKLHQSLHKSSRNRYKLRRRPIPTKSSCPWKMRSSSPWTNSSRTWAF